MSTVSASWIPAATQLLGERVGVGSTGLWASTVTDYANGSLSATQVERRVEQCLSLDPSFTVPARLGALMVSTLPEPSVEVHRRILQRGANADRTDDWFARAMLVSLLQGDNAPADLVTAWQHRAYTQEVPWR